MDKDTIIQRPPKIYLDTRDLINIAKVRKGEKPQPLESEENYRNIDKCIKSYGCLIFNPYAALEWVEGNATIDSARGIASRCPRTFWVAIPRAVKALDQDADADPDQGHRPDQRPRDTERLMIHTATGIE